MANYAKDILPAWIRGSTNIHPYKKHGDLLTNARQLTRYIKRIEHLMEAMGITEAPHKKKLLLYSGGLEFVDINELYPDGNEADEYKKLVAKLKKFYLVDSISVTARLEFHQSAQKTTESINEFYNRLSELWNDTGYTADTTKDEYIRDRIIAGTHMAKVRQEVLEKKDMSLAEVLEHANCSAIATNQSSVMKPNTGYSAVHYVHNNSNKNRQNQPKNENCFNCGWKRHTGGQTCPAKDQKCKSCGKMNHFAKVCLSKAKNGAQTKFNNPRQSKKKFHKNRKFVRSAEESKEDDTLEKADINVLSALVNDL